MNLLVADADIGMKIQPPVLSRLFHDDNGVRSPNAQLLQYVFIFFFVKRLEMLIFQIFHLVDHTSGRNGSVDCNF